EYDGGTMASATIRKNITDITLYDINDWENKKLEKKNNIKPEQVKNININSYVTEDTEVNKDGDKISDNGKEIIQNKVETLGDGSYQLTELDDGGFISDITKEFYYRYTVDWFTIIATLLIVCFVLITVSVKLSKLFFELAFNYLLANIIAPADVHSGQKIKQVIQNILNIFFVMIMIFLSIKVYMIGTTFIQNHFTGLMYLIAMLGFALAVIDGPNMVERLFGIDAGLKSGWGAIAGTYAMARGAGGIAKGAGSLAKNAGKGGFNLAKGAGKATGATASKVAGGGAGAVGLAKGLASKQGESFASPQQQNQDKSKNEDVKGKQQMQEGKSQAQESSKSNGKEEQNQGFEQASATTETNNGQNSSDDTPVSLQDEMEQK